MEKCCILSTLYWVVISDPSKEQSTKLKVARQQFFILHCEIRAISGDLIADLTHPVKYFISKPLDGSECVELFSFDRRITAPAGQRTKNMK